ncbi:TonB-dependent receptor [Sulfidibacter corallicola]|uniref:TonB-dependent receptor n=1 Tax=Sulfidibacter corallicola TaxID=2818388 RepID=A0A8A4TEC5_SULCO|nr:TonB-dependent receptor [Sulfidibacter corallicola]QTD47907.1 TonB-dependent receptor [Sulfidibacter corallicola]
MNKRLIFAIRSLLLLGSVILPAMAQQTGSINGSVVDGSDEPLPGVVITLESPALQGTRSAVSAETGHFLVRLLPPGIYTLTATMPGMRTVKLETRVSVASATRPRIVMEPDTQTETMVVMADRIFELDTTQVATNFESEFVEKLPRDRGNLEDVAKLAPGVKDSAFGGITINGAQSTENVFFLNGALINADNVRGRVDNLFIEDDIQESQVITGNASAEFGFFAGGLVNTITKSGGNEFHGTFRTQFTNESWSARNPLQLESGDDKVSQVNQEYTLTVNGPIVKDRLWFAFAGRNYDTDETRALVRGTAMSDATAEMLDLPTGQTAPGAISYDRTRERERFQLKLTGSISEGHTVVASYLKDEDTLFNRATFTTLHPSGLNPRSANPSELYSINYRGIITPAFTVDANFADRVLEFDSGINTDSRVAGTSVLHRDQRNAYSNSPFGSGNVINERSSRNWNVKFSYFYNSANLGSHDITFGVQEVMESRDEDNHQSASGWQLRPRWTRFDGDDPIGVYTSTGTRNGSAWIIYFPVVNPSRGSDFTTRAGYINDVWTLNEHWYFNIGLRYDENDARAEDGQVLSKTDNVSPRFTVNYDLRGDGVHQFSAGYNVYTGKLNNAAQGGSTAGQPATFAWLYGGPQTESIEEVFAWIDQTFPGGIEGVENVNLDTIRNPHLFFIDYSPDTSPENLSTVVRDGGLNGLSVQEYSLGYKHKLGHRGYLKGDIIHREYDDFLIGIIDRTTGQTAAGVDRTILANDDNGDYERDYLGVSVSGQYTWENNFLVGGNYTWSEAEGNINGETSGNGAISTTRTTTYPEFNHPFVNPVGRASDSNEHQLNLWASYDMPTSFGDFNFSLLHTFNSALPYGVVGTLDIAADPTAFGFPSYDEVSHYATPPRSVTYHFTDPDALEWDDIHSTDLAVNYSYMFRERYELFLQMEVTNIFNNDGIIDGDTTVDTAGAEAFNVFDETPQEGVHYNLGQSFGKGTASGDFQAPREFRFDVGVKF